MTVPPRWLIVQSAGLPILIALILFGAGGRADLPLYWIYVAIIAAVSVGGLYLIGEDLARERMRPGGKPLPWSLRLGFLLCSCIGASPVSTAVAPTGRMLCRSRCGLPRSWFSSSDWR